MFAIVADVEQRYELENLRRSLSMLTPGVPALSREEALALLSELSTPTPETYQPVLLSARAHELLEMIRRESAEPAR